jgi:hypothetical protein
MAKNLMLCLAAVAALTLVSPAFAQCVDDGRVTGECTDLGCSQDPQIDCVTDSDCIGEDNFCINVGSGDECTDNGDCPPGEFCAGEFFIDGGQVNMSGATLFVDFFTAPASTNDWIDVDGDGFAGYDPNTPPFVDQLATIFVPGERLDAWWLFNYRSVGSVNGLKEFIQNQLCQTIPTGITSERGLINHFSYSEGGSIVWGGPYANASGTPYEQCAIDGAFLDVPGEWGLQLAGDMGAWNREPGDMGYGKDSPVSFTNFGSELSKLSRDCDGNGEDESFLNLNRFENPNNPDPDANTIYSFVGAWVPVSYITNRGSGYENMSYTMLQTLYTTGRLPNGENLVAVNRDAGSGTRNAAMNSTGIDPSWGRADNNGDKNSVKERGQLGPDHQASNCGGSSVLEEAVQHRRLSVGYTGLAGGSRSARDVKDKKYEIMGIIKDIDGCVDPVRPTVETVLNNCGCDGFQIAGSGSFVVRGHPDANRDPADPKYNAQDPAMTNQAVADFLNNLFDNIESFEAAGFEDECDASGACSDSSECHAWLCSISMTACVSDGQCPDGETCDYLGSGTPCTEDGDCGSGESCDPIVCQIDDDCPMGETCEERGCSNDLDCPLGDGDDYCKSKNNMPAQDLVDVFFLPAGLDCVHDFENPTTYFAVDPVNEVLQSFILANNDLGANAQPDGSDYEYGIVTPAGLSPQRQLLVGDVYSDGSTQDFFYWNGTSWSTLAEKRELSERNETQGDFNTPRGRDADDVEGLVEAYYGPRAWGMSAAANGNGDTGDTMTNDIAIPEVIGDFDGDGSLTKEDLRYWADGLHLEGGMLSRKMGAIRVDNAISGMSMPFPWADTRDVLVEGVAPVAGVPQEPNYLAPVDIADFLATGATYEAGDFRADVAGRDIEEGYCRKNTEIGCFEDDDCPIGDSCYVEIYPRPGAEPRGWDGVVDAADIDYVCQNLGVWGAPGVTIDLSCDMDSVVDGEGFLGVTLEGDVATLVEDILETNFGDANLDGVVDGVDLGIVEATIADGTCNTAGNCGWADGDFNCDGVVDAEDYVIVGGCPGNVTIISASDLAAEYTITPMSGPVVDARQPYDPLMPEVLQGIGVDNGANDNRIVIDLGEAGHGLCLTLCEGDVADAPNAVASVADQGDGTYIVELTRAITPEACTVIKYVGDGSSVSFVSHPANLNADGQAESFEVLQLIDYLNGVNDMRAWGEYSSDINHSGVTESFDVIRMIDVLSATGPYAPGYNGTALPTCDACN